MRKGLKLVKFYFSHNPFIGFGVNFCAESYFVFGEESAGFCHAFYFYFDLKTAA